MRYRLAAAVAGLGAVITLSACTAPTDPDADTTTTWNYQSDSEIPDCDAGDRRKQEIPDCGFRHRGTFYAWSWVKRGQTTAPAGWRPGPEQAAVRNSAAPVRPRTSPGAGVTQPRAAQAQTGPSRAAQTQRTGKAQAGDSDRTSSSRRSRR